MTKAKDELKQDKPKYPNQQISLCIPIPPSKNHAYFYRSGRKLQKNKTKKYIEQIRKYVEEEIAKQKWKKDKHCVWYYIDMYFYFPDKRQRDSHNSIEVLMDTLETVLFPNDYYIMPRIQLVELDRENPRLELIMSAKER